MQQIAQTVCIKLNTIYIDKVMVMVNRCIHFYEFKGTINMCVHKNSHSHNLCNIRFKFTLKCVLLLVMITEFRSYHRFILIYLFYKRNYSILVSAYNAVFNIFYFVICTLSIDVCA